MTRAAPAPEHTCWSYDDHRTFVLQARAFLHAGLSAGERVWYVPGQRSSGVTGWLLTSVGPGGSDLPSGLAGGIDAALAEMQDPDRREALQQACRQWAASFSWETMHRDAVRVVQRALECC